MILASPILLVGQLWWLADAAGGLIIAPVIVLWAMTPLRPFSKRHLTGNSRNLHSRGGHWLHCFRTAG